MELTQWKKDLEYDLNKLNGDLTKLEQALEELKFKRALVDEACTDFVREHYHEEGYLFKLRDSLTEQINKKEKELADSRTNPNRVQIEILLGKIEQYVK
jgi:hypothetical protein